MKIHSKGVSVLETKTISPAAHIQRAKPSHSSAIPLPDKPLVVIEQSKSWMPLDLASVWSYRELLYFLIWRDLKVRYKQTLLGIAWVVLQPVMMAIIFTLFLSVLMRVPSDGVSYPLFVYGGLLVWTFFSSAVTSSGQSLISNAHLITKVYFPRLIVPIASVIGRLIDLAIGFGILAVMLIYYRVAPSWKMLALIPILVLATLLATGCGLLLSALNVKYRDVSIMLPVAIQLLMYVSPVIYPSRLVYERLGEWGWVYSLNPVVGIVDGFRAAIFNGTFNRFALGVSVAITLCLLVGSALVFRRVENSFADII